MFRKNGRIYDNDSWTFQNNPLETVKEFKYLGYTFSSSGSFTAGTKSLRTSAIRAIFNVKCIMQQFKELTPRLQILLFNTTVKPILEYGCEVWGACTAKPLDIVHIKFLKYVLGVRQNTPNQYVYGELGIYPLYVDRHLRMIKYWLKVVTSSQNSLIHIMYNKLKEESDNDVGILNWASNIRNILQINGFGYVWEQQGVIDSVEVFLKKLKIRIKDQYIQTWNEQVANTSNHRLYRQIKTTFQFENYLSKLENSNLRKALSKIRLGAHNFLIERGRWGVPKIEFSDRKCPSCKCIEDEFHCIIECHRFNVQRKHLPDNLKKKPSMYDFISLLNSEDVNNMKKLAVVCRNVLSEYEKNK